MYLSGEPAGHRRCQSVAFAKCVTQGLRQSDSGQLEAYVNERREDHKMPVIRAYVAFILGLRLTTGLRTTLRSAELCKAMSRRALVRRPSTTVAEKEEVLSPKEEEAKLLKTIDGKPRVGVSGFFDEASRTDQFVLDVLHAQKTWGSIVAFASEPAAAKKKLMSRSARYSGLLDVLSFETLTKDDFKAMIESAGCSAFLAFGVEPAKVGEYLKAADEAVCCSRVVIASTGDVGQMPKVSDSLEWTVVVLDVNALLDDMPEGGPVAIDRQDSSSGSISRQDAYRFIAEAFLIEPLTKRSVKLAQGNDYAVKYLRQLREQGYSRRGEIAKIVNGGLQAYEDEAIAAEEAKLKNETAANVVSEQERQEEYQRLMEEARREEQEKREREIAATARDYLARQWTEKKYSSARGLTKEEYIEIEWSKGVKEAAAILGYTTKDRARGIRTEDDDDDDDDADDEE